MAFILGPGKPALGFLCDIPNQFEPQNGFIVVAWARQSGVGLLQSALKEYLHNTDILVGMANRGTSAEALSYLSTLTRRVYVYHTHHLQTFHPKFYLFDSGESPPSDATLLVGSSNLTGGGLYQNIEGNFILKLKPADCMSDCVIYKSVIDEIVGLIDSPFCEQLTSEEMIQDLLLDGYLSTESDLNRNRQAGESLPVRRGHLFRTPSLPPPQLPTFRSSDTKYPLPKY